MKIITPWRSQPQFPIGIDRANPLTRGLVFAASGQTARSAITGDMPAVNAPNAIIARPYGYAWYFSGSTSESIQWATPITSGDMSMSVIAEPTATFGINTSLVGLFEGVSGEVANYLATQNSLGNTYNSWATDGADWTGADSGIVETPGVVKKVGASFSSGNYHNIIIDGRNIFTDATPRTPTGLTKIVLGGYLTGGIIISPWTGYLSLPVVWNRVLSDGEWASFHANPWQIFQPLQRRLWAATAAAAAGGPFPFFTRGRQAGGFTDMSGGIT